MDSEAELYECERYIWQSIKDDYTQGVKKMFDDAAMLFEYERRKETDPKFALTLDEFAVLWRAKNELAFYRADLEAANKRIKELEEVMLQTALKLINKEEQGE